jgi:hypothetical protein
VIWQVRGSALPEAVGDGSTGRKTSGVGVTTSTDLRGISVAAGAQAETIRMRLTAIEKKTGYLKDIGNSSVQFI